MNDSKIFIHPSSFVDEGAQIGDGTKIWHFCHIFPNAQIGQNCKIGQNVVVHSTVKIGNNAKIQNNVSLYDGVILEDDVFCGPSCVFTNIFNPRSAVSRNSAEFYRKTLVQKGATIGANATIVCGVIIGRYAFIGAGTVVTKDVGDYELIYGVPGKRGGWMCECGEKLEFLRNRAVCKDCRREYRKDKKGVQKI
ncbi:MAG: N-acetyltransferase [Candidatus Omnitrophica bacterium]|nr:N-acetyltransferase [Candidatus Omnitrophota bacterium]